MIDLGLSDTEKEALLEFLLMCSSVSYRAGATESITEVVDIHVELDNKMKLRGVFDRAMNNIRRSLDL